MGANYGAVYVRGAQRKDVRTLLEQCAAEKNTRFLLAPVIRGWLAVYPQEYGADGAVAEQIASAFDATALHVFQHDESLLGYSYYRGGILVDEYCSDPDYFESVSQAEQDRLRGRPELLVDLLASPDLVPQLDAVMHPADGALGFASYALVEFARLLNLPNACTCYEYLREDGWIERVMRFFTIQGLWRFEHVPNLRDEKKARRRRLKQRAQRWQDLKADGKLLAYQPGRVGWIINSEPHLCPNQAGDGFYVFSESDRDHQIRELAPPWNEPRPSRLDVDGTRTVMALSPSGRWLAIGHGYGPGHSELWDMSQPAKFKDLPTTTANEFDFTPDESKLLVLGTGELMVFDLPEGNLIKRSKVPGGVSRGVFDPSGRFLVLVLADELVLFDWQRGKRVRRWKLGDRIDPTPEMEAVREDLQDQMDEVSPADFDKHFRKMAKQLNLPAGESQKMLDEARENYSKMMAMIQSTDFAEQFAAERGSESPVRIRFTRDGRLLLCATDQGLRVYRWAEFPGVLEALEAQEEPASAEKGKKKLEVQFAPAPLYAVEGEAYREDGEEEHFDDINPGKYIYALEYDADRERCLYAGMGGVIGALDLATGEHRTLAELPSWPTIMQLALSRDGRALACTTLPQFHRSTKKLAAEVCVWNYGELMA